LAQVAQATRQHPRVTLLEGSSTSEKIVSQIRQVCQGRRTMVILDSDHSRDHVLAELAAYAPLVSPGCYLICEDTNVNGHPSFPDHGPGPYEAVEEFLKSARGWKVDRDCER